MALSEDEQRELERLQRSLEREDPGLARTLRRMHAWSPLIPVMPTLVIIGTVFIESALLARLPQRAAGLSRPRSADPGPGVSSMTLLRITAMARRWRDQ